jgi:hypothetical protein
VSGQQVGPMAQYSQRERRELLERVAELERHLAASHAETWGELESTVEDVREEVGVENEQLKRKVAELEGERDESTVMHVAMLKIEHGQLKAKSAELQAQLARAREEIADLLAGADADAFVVGNLNHKIAELTRATEPRADKRGESSDA